MEKHDNPPRDINKMAELQNGMIEAGSEELQKAYVKGFECAKGEGKIYRALAAVQARVKAAGKSGSNEYDHYSYAMLNDYCEVIRVPMAENGLALAVDIEKVDRLTPRKTARGGEEQVVIVIVKGILMHESGESISFTGYGEGQDRSDKAIYKAITGAKKYLIANIFNVPTSDDPEKDSDAERDTAQGKQRAPAAPPVTQRSQQRPPAQQQRQQQQTSAQQGTVQQQRPPAQRNASAQQPPPAQRPLPSTPPPGNYQPPEQEIPAAPQQPPVQTPPPAPKTDEQREESGCINAQQYDNITSSLVSNKIGSKLWRGWLKLNYGHNSAQDIKQSELSDILKTINTSPNTILQFGK